MAERDGSRPNDTMRERAESSRVKLWVLMRLNRYLLSVAILLGVFVALVLLSFAELSPLSQVASESNAVQYLFSAMIGAIITGVTLVVTIAQLVLSQELGAVGEQRERMQSALAFRRDVEQHGELTVSPAEPAAFLRELLSAIERRGEQLRDAAGNEPPGDRIRAYVDDMDEHARAVRRQMEGTEFGTFDLIWTALNFNYSRKIHQAREIQHEHAGSLSDEADDAIDGVIDALGFFGPAREHFKTLYFQWELINLSRALLYASVPALVVVVGTLLYVDGEAVAGATLGVPHLVWLTSAAVTVSLAPFVVLLAYILRIATVAQRTLAMGPFVLRGTGSES